MWHMINACADGLDLLTVKREKDRERDGWFCCHSSWRPKEVRDERKKNSSICLSFSLPHKRRSAEHVWTSNPLPSLFISPLPLSLLSLLSLFYFQLDAKTKGWYKKGENKQIRLCNILYILCFFFSVSVSLSCFLSLSFLLFFFLLLPPSVL